MWELASRRELPTRIAGVERDGDRWVWRWTHCELMGVVNVTPDSFSDGGQFASADAAIDHGRSLVEAGAAIIDIGGESTRPHAAEVSEAEELRRVIPVVEALAADSAALISVDTRKPGVARAAIGAGAHIINDVSGLRDPEMVGVAAELGVPVVIMHMRGTPADMQNDPRYGDVVAEVTAFLRGQADAAIAAGVPSVIVDPGIGFGKTVEHNLALVRALPLDLAHPTLVGMSRKRSMRQLSGARPGEPVDAASIAAHVFAAQRGVALVRAHDVAGHRQALTIDRALRG